MIELKYRMLKMVNNFQKYIVQNVCMYVYSMYVFIYIRMYVFIFMFIRMCVYV